MDGDKRPDQLDSPVVAKLIKVGSRFNTRLYRLTGGRVGGTWRIGAGLRKPAPVCLLTTIGRKSGQPRTAPLIYLADGDRFVVVASQGGLPKHPAWYLNLQANPHVTIEVGGDKHELTARTASPAEKAQLWPRLVALYADFETYDAWTEREIPVVICEPRG
ncbi:nitroreductase family deazaflavin-dependent oxidoreductase [Gordonia sp. (in: high G+C Gram-positive bacteria)]|uniref:nitroreductase family deazaflavin-dependent oxidoreductase n=1 Tax=Gordonia sp. (in: high G+C Gram-positive bacteria) TaxID=84139 RepID=UPI0039E62B1F